MADLFLGGYHMSIYIYACIISIYLSIYLYLYIYIYFYIYIYIYIYILVHMDTYLLWFPVIGEAVHGETIGFCPQELGREE